MFKRILTSCLAIALIAIGSQVASAQCGGGCGGGHGCRISNAFHNVIKGSFGGSNCGREISNYEAAGLWANYCTDTCTINGGCGGCGSTTGCGCGFSLRQRGCNALVDNCGQSFDQCGGHAGCGLGGKFRGLFARGGNACGNTGCDSGCFGYPGGCGTGCNTGCGQSSGGFSCGGGKLFAGLHSRGGLFARHQGCGNGCGHGCGLFKRGNWHDRLFSGFYAKRGACNATYFGNHVGPETGFADFTSAVNGQLTGSCGCNPVHPGVPVETHSRSIQADPVPTAEPQPQPRPLPGDVQNHDGASYQRLGVQGRVARSVLEPSHAFRN